jgi:hypothetical protein
MNMATNLVDEVCAFGLSGNAECDRAENMASTDTGKPVPAVPVTNTWAQPGAAASGGVTTPPFPIPTVDGALYLAAETIWGETWPARHNHELWLVGPDGTYEWRNQCDGTFDSVEGGV